MTSRELLVLHMDRDDSTGKWQCPVLNKPFTNRTKIVAIRQRPPGNEANVFSYEAYHELNLKPKNNLDLISGLKFTKEDVIILQDPEDQAHVKLRDIHHFKHINSLRAEEHLRQENSGNVDPKSGVSGNVRHSVTASRIMEKLEKEKRKRERSAEDESRKLIKAEKAGDESSSSLCIDFFKQKIYTDELLISVNLTSGKASGSLTSTVMNITRENKAREATEEEIISSQCEALKRLKKKGLVRMFTNLGAMDIEIHCDIVPRAAMNFLLLAEKKEYEGSKFHRSIPNFMIQGGKKPGKEGNAKGGGGSYWEKPFSDEFDDRLTHTGSGIVSMANSGPGTNARQFFITYKSAAHLDRKHSVFGKVVRGSDVLRRMEQVPTDKQTDRPLEVVRIEQIEILANPVIEALDMERERILKRKEEKLHLDQSLKSSALGRISSSSAKKDFDSDAAASSKSAEEDSSGGGIVIGKYLKVAKKKSSSSKSTPKAEKVDASDVNLGEAVMKSRLPPPPKKTTFGDFSGW